MIRHIAEFTPMFFLKRRSKKTQKLCVTDLCEGNPQLIGGPPQKGPITRKMFPFDDVIMYFTSTGPITRLPGKHLEYDK